MQQIDIAYKYNGPTAKIKNYVIINGINFFDQPVNNDERACDNIWEVTNGCQLDYTYFK